MTLRTLLLAGIASAAISTSGWAQESGETIIPPPTSDQSQSGGGEGSTSDAGDGKVETQATSPEKPEAAAEAEAEPVKKNMKEQATPADDAQSGEKKDENVAEEGGKVKSEESAGANKKKAMGEITAEKKTVIKEKIVNKNVKKVDRTSIDFNISVGVAVPRTLDLVVLPPAVVEVVPEYEGYLYFVMDDGTLVIVHPASMEIVYVIA